MVVHAIRQPHRHIFGQFRQKQPARWQRLPVMRQLVEQQQRQPLPMLSRGEAAQLFRHGLQQPGQPLGHAANGRPDAPRRVVAVEWGGIEEHGGVH